MAMLIKLENGKPIGHAIVEQNFRQLFPNVSFPAYLTADSAAPFGYGLYDFSNQPEKEKHKKIVEVEPIKNEFGVWRQTWALAEMNAEEKAQADAEKSKQARAERNYKLTQCDWTQLADSTADKAAWATYRQALRDVPDQAGFPWEITWPVAP